ncbi:MAG: energy-coupling factor ABC transporter ATP-binding protein [Candidatus Asgardarchaeia archaeon]
MCSIVQLQDVWFSYDGKRYVIRGISLELKSGDMVALLGHNGSGKTTLAKLIAGLIKPSKGKVIVDGSDITELSSRDIIRKVGIVFQNPDIQIFERTVYDEIAFVLRNIGLSEDEIKERVIEEAKRFGIDGYLEVLPNNLSGGERKRVAFASVTVLKPKVLILDEPSRGMDYRRKLELMEFLEEMREEGTCVLFITHDVEFVAERFERVIIMKEGKIFLEGFVEDVLSKEELNQAGLENPFVSRLSKELRDIGISRDATSVEDFCQEYIAILGGKR